MSIHVAINHKTHYRYAHPVELTPHIFRLRPAPHSRTPIEAYSLTIRPDPHFINWQQDAFGNFLARVVFPEKVSELYVEVDVVADMTVINPFDFFVEAYAETYPFAYSAQEAKELAPYLEISEDGPRLRQWLSTVDRETETPIIDFLVALNQRLWRDIEYNIRMEPGIQSCEETLGKANGSCRDSAWVLVQALRHLRLAARFASGYLVQLTADQESLDGPSGPTADFTDLHAWAEVYVPGAGWIGLDATSGLFAGEGHIPLACTPDPVSAAPVTGGVEPVETTFTFSNTVQRIHEDPRVTLPYTEGQWEMIQELGRAVDAELDAQDVRLTMGGEPTFVSIDDMEADEWNITADGPHKRELAGDLIRRLRNAFGQGGILHYGQGKWYPGEPLPRWKLAAMWRTDGVALWHDDRLFADIDKNYGHGPDIAAQFGRQLAQQLGLGEEYLMPAYEDLFFFLWQEGQIPVNVNPAQADLSDSGERRKLAHLLEQGMETPVGYVLPVRWHEASAAWESSQWPLRRQALFLIPGDSPIGLRLPLDTLPEPDEDEEEPFFERDPFDEVPELTDYYEELAEARPGPTHSADYNVATEGGEVASIVRTAICLEPRAGRLHVFMPPPGSLGALSPSGSGD
jgi:transglutaminase-like putative cysteine protease